MSVYVDDMQAKFGRMVMCHMLADSEAELLEMADKIGVPRKWYQRPGMAKTSTPHFDIALTKKALAIRHGAIALDRHKDPDLMLAVIFRSRKWWHDQLAYNEMMKVAREHG